MTTISSKSCRTFPLCRSSANPLKCSDNMASHSCFFYLPFSTSRVIIPFGNTFVIHSPAYFFLLTHALVVASRARQTHELRFMRFSEARGGFGLKRCGVSGRPQAKSPDSSGNAYGICAFSARMSPKTMESRESSASRTLRAGYFLLHAVALASRVSGAFPKEIAYSRTRPRSNFPLNGGQNIPHCPRDGIDPRA